MTDYNISIKVRNAPLLKAIKKAGYKTVDEFIKFNKLPSASFYRYLYLQTAPYDAEKGEFKKNALDIAEILGCTVWDIFPLHHIEIPLENSESEIEVSLDDIRNLADLLTPEQIFIAFERKTIIQESMALLNDREREIIEARYKYGLLYTEIAQDLGISNTRVCQIERKAFEKMTTGNRKKKLKSLI